MSKRSCFLAGMCLVLLGPLLSGCNFPGLATSSESQPLVTEIIAVTPTRSASEPLITEATRPTKPPNQSTSDQSEEGSVVRAKEDLNCLVAPKFGTEVVGVLRPGDKAIALGRTPNNEWFSIQLKEKQKPCWVPSLKVEFNFDPSNLAVVLPPNTPTPGLGSISGVLWHEICEFTGGQAGEPLVLGKGCVQWGDESYEFGPNQVYDPFESGWASVTLHLGMGVCPSTGLATTVTNADGEYSFADLSAGVYCVSYSNLADGNDNILIPGGPTYPERGEAGFYWTVDLTAGEDRTDVNFGYAFQFYD